ncbi:MAG: MFS transporter, partial [Actinobacteria bacterium]|nr:MFS transporter [Actinomycetota bacterium]
MLVDLSTWRGRALTPVLIYIGLVTSVMSSLGAPLVPTMASEFHVSLANAQWSLTICLLVGGVSAPVIGRLADGPRRKPVLLVTLAILALASALAALPAGFALLLVGRAGQGLGLALLPLVMGVARDHLPAEQSRRALATLSVTAVVGIGLGYPLTGLVAEHLSFRAGFWIAALFSLTGIGLSVLVVPGSRHRHKQPFDIVGALLLGIGVASVLVAVSESDAWGWTSVRLVG